MKKNLLTLAVFSIFANSAQAQSNVTIYGILDAGVFHENNGTTTTTSLNKIDHTGNLNANRLGFKGSEDLGNGMSAIFQLEMGLNVDDGTQADTNKLFNRQSFVGLTGNFGAVKLGRQLNPVYANSTTFDPFGDALAGDSARLFSYNGSRTDNLIAYDYNAYNFRNEVQYGIGEVAGNNSASRTIAGFSNYKNGPIDAVLSYQNINNPTGTAGTKMTLLGGNYDLGILKLFATMAWEKGVILGTTNKLDQRDALIGLTAPVSKSSNLIASYIKKTDNVLANAGASQLAIGYVYNLSKRTALYSSYGVLHNDSSAVYKVTVAGKSDSVLNAGLRHSF